MATAVIRSSHASGLGLAQESLRAARCRSDKALETCCFARRRTFLTGRSLVGLPKLSQRAGFARNVAGSIRANARRYQETVRFQATQEASPEGHVFLERTGGPVAEFGAALPLARVSVVARRPGLPPPGDTEGLVTDSGPVGILEPEEMELWLSEVEWVDPRVDIDPTSISRAARLQMKLDAVHEYPSWQAGPRKLVTSIRKALPPSIGGSPQGLAGLTAVVVLLLAVLWSLFKKGGSKTGSVNAGYGNSPPGSGGVERSGGQYGGLQSAKNQVSNKVGGVERKVHRAVGSAERKIETVTEDAKKRAQASIANLKKKVENVKQADNKVEQGGKEIKATLESGKRSVKDLIQEANPKLNKRVENVKRADNKVEQTGKEIKGSLDSGGKEIKATLNSGKRTVKDLIQEANPNLNKRVENVKRADNKVEQTGKEIKGSLDSGGKEIKATLESGKRTAKDLIQEANPNLNKRVENVKQADNKVEQTGKEIKGSLDSGGKEIKATLESGKRTAKDLIQEANPNLKRKVENVKQADNKVEQTGKEIKDSLDSGKRNVKDMAQDANLNEKVENVKQADNKTDQAGKEIKGTLDSGKQTVKGLVQEGKERAEGSTGSSSGGSLTAQGKEKLDSLKAQGKEKVATAKEAARVDGSSGRNGSGASLTATPTTAEVLSSIAGLAVLGSMLQDMEARGEVNLSRFRGAPMNPDEESVKSVAGDIASTLGGEPLPDKKPSVPGGSNASAVGGVPVISGITGTPTKGIEQMVKSAVGDPASKLSAKPLPEKKPSVPTDSSAPAVAGGPNKELKTVSSGVVGAPTKELEQLVKSAVGNPAAKLSSKPPPEEKNPVPSGSSASSLGGGTTKSLEKESSGDKGTPPKENEQPRKSVEGDSDRKVSAKAQLEEKAPVSSKSGGASEDEGQSKSSEKVLTGGKEDQTKENEQAPENAGRMSDNKVSVKAQPEETSPVPSKSSGALGEKEQTKSSEKLPSVVEGDPTKENEEPQKSAEEKSDSKVSGKAQPGEKPPVSNESTGASGEQGQTKSTDIVLSGGDLDPTKGSKIILSGGNLDPTKGSKVVLSGGDLDPTKGSGIVLSEGKGDPTKGNEEPSESGGEKSDSKVSAKSQPAEKPPGSSESSGASGEKGQNKGVGKMLSGFKGMSTEESEEPRKSPMGNSDSKAQPEQKPPVSGKSSGASGEEGQTKSSVKGAPTEEDEEPRKSPMGNSDSKQSAKAQPDEKTPGSGGRSGGSGETGQSRSSEEVVGGTEGTGSEKLGSLIKGTGNKSSGQEQRGGSNGRESTVPSAFDANSADKVLLARGVTEKQENGVSVSSSDIPFKANSADAVLSRNASKPGVSLADEVASLSELIGRGGKLSTGSRGPGRTATGGDDVASLVSELSQTLEKSKKTAAANREAKTTSEIAASPPPSKNGFPWQRGSSDQQTGSNDGVSRSPITPLGGNGTQMLNASEKGAEDSSRTPAKPLGGSDVQMLKASGTKTDVTGESGSKTAANSAPVRESPSPPKRTGASSGPATSSPPKRGSLPDFWKRAESFKQTLAETSSSNVASKPASEPSAKPAPVTKPPTETVPKPAEAASNPPPKNGSVPDWWKRPVDSDKQAPSESSTTSEGGVISQTPTEPLGGPGTKMLSASETGADVIDRTPTEPLEGPDTPMLEASDTGGDVIGRTPSKAVAQETPKAPSESNDTSEKGNYFYWPPRSDAGKQAEPRTPEKPADVTPPKQALAADASGQTSTGPTTNKPSSDVSETASQTAAKPSEVGSQTQTGTMGSGLGGGSSDKSPDVISETLTNSPVNQAVKQSKTSESSELKAGVALGWNESGESGETPTQKLVSETNALPVSGTPLNPVVSETPLPPAVKEPPVVPAKSEKPAVSKVTTEDAPAHSEEEPQRDAKEGAEILERILLGDLPLPDPSKDRSGIIAKVQNVLPAVAVSIGATSALFAGIDGALETVGFTAIASFAASTLLWSSSREELKKDIEEIKSSKDLEKFLKENNITPEL